MKPFLLGTEEKCRNQIFIVIPMELRMRSGFYNNTLRNTLRI